MSNTSKTKQGFSDYGLWRGGQGFDEAKIASGVGGLYRELLEYKLRQLRTLKSLTQAQLATELGVTQNRISKFERLDLDKAELQTIRSYVRALGGELEVVVKLDGVNYPLSLNEESN